MPNFIFSSQPIKAIIFDCDGTLVDSEEAHLCAWRRVVNNYGGSLSAEEYPFFVGKPDSIIARLLAEKISFHCADTLLAQKREYFAEYIHKGLPPIEGTVKFIHRLLEENSQFGLKLAVASAATKYEILTNLKSVGLENAFDLVLSGHEDLSDYSDPEGVNKPKPYIYLHTAKLLGVSPAECIVIEDSHTGVTSSVTAGCITVAVPHAYSKDQDLSNAQLRLESLLHLSVENLLDIALQSSQYK